MATSVVALVAAIVLFPLCPNSASAALNPCRNGNLTGLKLANIVRNLSGHVNSLNNSPTDPVFTEVKLLKSYNYRPINSIDAGRHFTIIETVCVEEKGHA